MPSFSMVSNSLLAMRSFSGESLLALAKVGGPLVGMDSVTLCLGCLRWKVGVVSSGVSCSRVWYGQSVVLTLFTDRWMACCRTPLMAV